MKRNGKRKILIIVTRDALIRNLHLVHVIMKYLDVVLIIIGKGIMLISHLHSQVVENKKQTQNLLIVMRNMGEGE
jgi:hypothetical protein